MIPRVIRLARLSGWPIYFASCQPLETSTREATFSRDRAPKLRSKVVVRQADLHARRTTKRITRFAGLRWYRPFNQARPLDGGKRSSPYPDRNVTRNSRVRRVSTFRFDFGGARFRVIGRLFAEPRDLMNTNSRGSRAISAARGKTEIAMPA